MSQVNVRQPDRLSPEAVRRRNTIIALSAVAGVLLLGLIVLFAVRATNRPASVAVDVQQATAIAAAGGGAVRPQPTAVVPTAVVPTAVVPTAAAGAPAVPTAAVPTAVVPTAVVPTALVPTAAVPTAAAPAAGGGTGATPTPRCTATPTVDPARSPTPRPTSAPGGAAPSPTTAC